MTALAGQPLAAALPLVGPVLALLAALALVSRRARRIAVPLLLLALAAELGSALAAAPLSLALGSSESVLFTWSPLGLYGVGFAVHRGSAPALIGIPALLLALAGLALGSRRRQWFAALMDETLGERAGNGFAVLTVACALWATRAGDLVSLSMAACGALLATCGLLALSAGQTQAGRRVLVVYGAAIALLMAILVLGRVNGHFLVAGLSTSGFTTLVFFGLAVAAGVSASVPPFHGWLLRSARHALAPAAGASGVAVALTLLLVAARTVEIQDEWQTWLRAAGWLAALVGSAVALTRHRPAVALAAVFVARAGAAFLAGSVASPAALGSVVLFLAVTLTALGLLWLTAAQPWGGHVRTRGPSTPPLKTPGFWLNALLLATAAGLPPTLGGLARSALAASVTAWPAGDQLLRVPLLLTDVAVLVAGSAVLWSPRFMPPVRGTVGWLWCAVAWLALCVPTAVPGAAVGVWAGPAMAEAAGVTSVPVALDAARVPSIPSAVLAVLALWVLAQRLRGKEWLPGPARAIVGILALGWIVLRQRWRTRGLSSGPAALADRVWVRFQAGAERAMLVLRPVEERYYAGAAVLMAVAMIYIIGR